MSVTPLTRLLRDDGPVREAYSGSEPLLLPDAISVGELPTSADIHRLLDGSLLRRPYFTVLHEGVRPQDASILASRNVDGIQVSGFIDATAVRGQLADGATLKLNQVEDWHPLIRRMNEELNSAFPVESKAFMFYTPAGKRGMLPHRDGSRVIAIQTEGAKEWHLYDAPTGTEACAGLDVDTSREQVLVLNPGDVLYLPHGYAHAATAVDQASVHVTFTLTEPFPAALAQAYIAEWAASGRQAAVALDAEAMPPAGRAGALLRDLIDFSEKVDGASLVERALITANTRDTSGWQ